MYAVAVPDIKTCVIVYKLVVGYFDKEVDVFLVVHCGCLSAEVTFAEVDCTVVEDFNVLIILSGRNGEPGIGPVLAVGEFAVYGRFIVCIRNCGEKHCVVVAVVVAVIENKTYIIITHFLGYNFRHKEPELIGGLWCKVFDRNIVNILCKL